ncbi:MAG: aminoglycoside phosphotransferase [Actinophytocola sp.]|uniref:phosphotransferase n=1 Tax=Actinophytocola sp. TaxID=1872138 RepID=UPI0013239B2D|nr:phosphotransferase [Actinophytocola sp.]MPZ84047.1 aminoglycoside phosphotransferase [Actinophytocola sp.]
MRDNLDHAAHHFDLTVTGEPVFGWRLRSVSAPTVGTGGDRWLRVVSQEPEWATGAHWTGTVDADAISGIRKPRVLDVYEWTDGRCQRAEVMTHLSGEPCSPTDVLRDRPDLTAHWWADLDGALATLTATPTHRVNADQEKVTWRIRERFGDDVDTTVTQWATVHGDLHWSNLLRPRFGLLDWELWGTGPAGIDEATLYCYSLLVPTIADQVHTSFARTLDTPAGRLAQLYVLARLLSRIDGGDYPDLAEPLHRHADSILAG